jgi:hypothetical protein
LSGRSDFNDRGLTPEDSGHPNFAHIGRGFDRDMHFHETRVAIATALVGLVLAAGIAAAATPAQTATFPQPAPVAGHFHGDDGR